MKIASTLFSVMGIVVSGLAAISTYGHVGDVSLQMVGLGISILLIGILILLMDISNKLDKK